MLLSKVIKSVAFFAVVTNDCYTYRQNDIFPSQISFNFYYGNKNTLVAYINDTVLNIYYLNYF